MISFVAALQVASPTRAMESKLPEILVSKAFHEAADSTSPLLVHNASLHHLNLLVEGFFSELLGKLKG